MNCGTDLKVPPQLKPNQEKKKRETIIILKAIDTSARPPHVAKVTVHTYLMPIA